MAALCGNGTNKLLEDGEGLVKIMVDSMDSSNPYSVQIEGLRLAQCLMVAIITELLSFILFRSSSFFPSLTLIYFNCSDK